MTHVTTYYKQQKHNKFKPNNIATSKIKPWNWPDYLTKIHSSSSQHWIILYDTVKSLTATEKVSVISLM